MAALAVAALLFTIAVGIALWLSWRFRAQTIAVSLVIFAALVFGPRLFVMDGIFLSDAKGLSASRLTTIAGLDVGAVAVAFLAFLVVGFIAPLFGSISAARRHDKGARESLRVHLGIILAAIVVAIIPLTPVWRAANFVLVQPTRERVVAQLTDGEDDAAPTAWRRGLQAFNPTAIFPRLACCGGVIYVMDDGRRILFPMTPFGTRAWGYVHMDEAAADAPPLRTLAKLSGGWRRVAIDWTQP